MPAHCYTRCYTAEALDPGRRTRTGDLHSDLKPGGSDPPRELAAYTATASVILNLDETITKE